MSFFYCRALSGAILFCLVGPVFADSDEHPTSELTPVKVEGSTLEETLPAELSNYGSQLEVIDRQTLDQTGMSDVSQALERLVPGLFVSPGAGRGSYVDVSLDGSRTKDVLWLIDGVRINNRLYGSTTPLDSITTQMIDHIEVLKGGQGLFYGTQAVAGVVNIVLRKPSDTPNGQLRLGTGTLHDRRVSGHAAGPGAGGEWLVFGAYDESEGYEPFRPEAYQSNALRQDRGFKRHSIGGKYRVSPWDDSSLNLLLVYNDVAADDAKPVNNLRSVNDRDEYIASIKWDQQLTDNLGYYIKGYYHSWWTDFTRVGLNADGSRNVINNADEWGYDDYGVNISGRYTFHDGSQVLAGYDLQSYSGRDYVLRIAEQNETVHAGFFQLRPVLPFSPDTYVALGARYNYSKFGGNHAIWNASVDQPLPRDLHLKASAGTNFLLPTAYQLFVTDPTYPAGNPDLGPEKSLNLRASLSGPIGSRIHWEVSGFYRKIDDLIAIQNGTFHNADNGVRVRGGEALVEFNHASGLHLDLSATYASSQATDSSEQIAGIPEWLARASLGWDDQKNRHGARISARYVGDNTQQLADFGNQQIGDYTVVDASAYQRFGDHLQHRLTLRLENLTDRRYAVGASQAEAPEGGVFRYETLGVPRNAQLSYSYTY